MKKERSVDGMLFTDDMSVWFSLLPSASKMAVPMNVKLENQDYSPEAYLQREEKIKSLLRNRTQKPFRKNSVLESVKDDWPKTLNFMAARLGEELKKKFQEEVEREGISSACEQLAMEFPHIVGLKIEPVKDDYVRRILSYCTDDIVSYNIAFAVPGWENIYFSSPEYKIGKRHDRRNWGFRKSNRYIYVADFQKLMTELYIRNYVIRYFRELRESCGNMGEYLKTRIVGRIANYYFANDLSVFTFSEEFLKLPEHPYCTVPERYSANTGAIYRLILDNHNPKGIAEVIDTFDLQKILTFMRKEYLQRKEESKMEKNLSGEYARSYQTKRNIPEKYLKAMRQSGFNEYFGYVEIDEDCDLALMPDLYREYRALCEVVGIPSYKDVSLRFRKLGNHHASGLYYPTLACLCVDIRSPHSMTHEVGHMIDYHCDHISEKRDFMDVFDCYQYLLKKYVDEKASKTEKAQLLGSGKYNISYYQQSTEVFARCFEMYLVRTMKVDNSLCRPETGFAYPEDDMLDRLSREFFYALLMHLKGESDEQAGRKIS